MPKALFLHLNGSPPIFRPYDPVPSTSKPSFVMCEICEKVMRRRHCSRHADTHLTDEERDFFYCPYFPCTTRVFGSRTENIDGHIRGNHTEPLVCPECPKVGRIYENPWTANMCHHYNTDHPNAVRPKWPRATFPAVLPTMEQVKEQHRLCQLKDRTEEVLPRTAASSTNTKVKEEPPYHQMIPMPLNTEDNVDSPLESPARDNDSATDPDATIRVPRVHSASDNFIERASLTRILPLPIQVPRRLSINTDLADQPSDAFSGIFTRTRAQDKAVGIMDASSPLSARSDYNAHSELPSIPSSPGGSIDYRRSSYSVSDYEERSTPGESDDTASGSYYDFPFPSLGQFCLSTSIAHSVGDHPISDGEDLSRGYRTISPGYQVPQPGLSSSNLSALPPRFHRCNSSDLYVDNPEWTRVSQWQQSHPAPQASPSPPPSQSPPPTRLPSQYVKPFRNGLFLVKGPGKTAEEWLNLINEKKAGKKSVVTPKPPNQPISPTLAPPEEVGLVFKNSFAPVEHGKISKSKVPKTTAKTTTTKRKDWVWV